MNLIEFLQDISIKGWQVWSENERLCYDAPQEESTPLVLARLKQQKTEILQLLREQPDILNVYPLSYGQQALWFLWQLAPLSHAYNVSFAASVCSEVDVTAMQKAFKALIERHPILRTNYPKLGTEPIQHVHSFQELDFRQIDASSWTEDRLKAQVDEAHQQHFDLETGSVMRVRWFTRFKREHILLLTMHHIACDGWSLDILMQEMSKLYSEQLLDTNSSLPLIKHSYQDYVNWQRKILCGDRGEKLWSYWQHKLNGHLPALNLPTDKQRPPIQTYNGASIKFKLSSKLTSQLKELAQKERATFYMMLLAAFEVLLYRYTGQEDILVGSPTSGRSQSEFAPIVGYFVDPMVMRADLSNNPTFKDFLSQVRQTVLGAIAHQDYPFALLVENLQPYRDSSRSPIFQACFVLQKFQKSQDIQKLLINETETDVDWGGLKLRPFELPIQEGQFDLTLEMMESSSEIAGLFKYNTNLFYASTVECMTAHFENLLEAIVKNPQLRVSEIPLLKDYEQEQLIASSNKIAVPYQLQKYIHSSSENLQIYILDNYQQLVPVGVEGEIYLENYDLSPQNLNPDVNFISHPRLGKLLETGEWGRRQKDGSIELLGKSRRIVSVKGQRINLQVIEQALLKVVKDCYVMLRNKKLVAYVVQEGQLSGEFLNNHLKSQLLGYPLPYAYVPVSALPLTEAGKVSEVDLANIGVIDSKLIPSWEEQIAAELEIEQVAVFIEQNTKTISPIHLEQLLPSSQTIFNQVTTQIEATSHLRKEKTSSSSQIKSPAISHGEALTFPESAPKSLGEMLRQTVEKFPHKGIIYINSDGSESVQSYAQLLEDAQIILGGLRKLGLKPQDKVIFQFKENKDFISAFWGCILGGLIPVPVGIPTSYDQSNANLNKLKNSWLLLEKPLVLTDNKSLIELKKWAINLNLENFNLSAIENLYKVAADKNYYNSQPEDLAILLLTSGSTGTPKAVKQSHQSLLSRSAGTIAMNNFTPEDISLNWFPLDHVGGIVMFHLRDVMTGCQQIHAPTQMVLQAPTLWLDWISKYRITTTWSPNFAYGLIIKELEKLNRNPVVKADHKWDLSSLKFILNGGEAIVPKTARRFLELLIPYQLSSQVMYPAWGMSETSSAVTFADNFLLELTTDEQKFVELGSPIPGFSIRITDNQNQVIEEGKTGFIQVKGASVTSGYYQNNTANLEAFTEDGWFNTGDLGFILKGRLTITGRQKDVIIINGANYYSHEIETAVEELSSIEVSYTAACGVSTAGNNTEELVIFFVPCLSEQNQLPSLLKNIREQVVKQYGINPSYLIPVEKEIIPKTSIGKIQRSLLKQRFENGDFKSIRQQVDLLLGNANTIPNWFYHKTWQPKENKNNLLTYSPQKTLTLIFADNLGLATKLREELSQQNQPYVQVSVGSDFARISPNHYSLVPGNPQHYRLLIDSLRENNQVIGQILHLWNYHEQTQEISGLENLESTQQQGVYSLLSLVQALEEIQGTQETVKLLWIANNSQSVNPTDKIEPQKATVFGLLKTVTQEKPWITTRHLDLPLAAELNNSYIWQELYCVDKELEVAIRNGQRFVSRLQSVDMIANEKQEIPFIKGGTYLLTGGLGGIGTVISKYLLENYQANLILVGRTKLSEDSEEIITKIQQLQELEKLPGSVVYEAVDICNLVGLQRVIEKATSQWGTQLDGVLHIAGIAGETPIKEETIDNVAAVLRPKVSATWVLHQLLKDKENALFVHFCSVNSFFGGANVAAYSAANSFQSTWSDYQKQNGLKSYCCSWSMWNETGMSQGYQFKELSRAKGYFTINPQQGINSFLAALSHPEHNLLIGLDRTKTNIERFIDDCQPKQKLTAYFTSSTPEFSSIQLQQLQLKDCFGKPCTVELVQLEQIPLSATGEIDREQLAAMYGGLSTLEQTKPRNQTEQKLVDIFQEVLNVSSVGIHDNFFELGGHSLLATQLISRLRETFSIEIPLEVLFESPTVKNIAEYLEVVNKVSKISDMPKLDKKRVEI
ncbi:MAG: SDR family NAD(P)-dependent oxidoreductase [Cyanobacteria bacterium P01_A01_bin.84]